MGACCEKPLDAVICIRIDELWMDTIQHARAVCAGNLNYPVVKVMHARKQMNIVSANLQALGARDSTTCCGSSFIFHDAPFRLAALPTPEKPFRFEFAHSPNYSATIRDVDFEGVRYVDVQCSAEANKKVGVLILSVAKQMLPDSFPPPPRAAVGGFLRRDHWTNFTVKVGAGQAFGFVPPGRDAKDSVTYTAYASLTSGGGEQGDTSAAPRWTTQCEAGAETVPNWGNKTHTFAKMRATPRALEIHIEGSRSGKDRNRGLCRIDLKDPLGWVKAGAVLFPVLPYGTFPHPNARVDQSNSAMLRKAGRVCMVDVPPEDSATDFSIDRAGFAAIHESGAKLRAFVDVAMWEQRRKEMDSVARQESIAKENAFIASVEAFFIEIGPDSAAAAAASAAPAAAAPMKSSGGGGKDDLEGVELQMAGDDKGTPNESVDLARRIRAHPKFARTPIFALIAPDRQLNVGSDNPFTIPPLKKPLKDEDVQFVLNRFCFNMGLLTVTLGIDYIPMTDDEKKAEAMRNPNSFDIEVSGSKRASMDRRAEETQREINETNKRLAEDAARQKAADEARAKLEAEAKAKRDEEDAERAAKQKADLEADAAAYKEKLMRQKNGDGTAMGGDDEKNVSDGKDDGTVELVDSAEAMALAWKKKAALALYKLNHVEKANEHAAANQATASAQLKSAEPLKLDVEVKSVALNYAIPPTSKLVYVVGVGNSIRDSAPLKVGAEGLLPHEQVDFRGGALTVDVKFKEKKAKTGAAAAAAAKKKPQPTILTISVFAYPADEEQYSAADLVGQFVSGETGSSGLNPPDVLNVTAFWRSIEGKRDTKRVNLYTIAKNGQAKHTGVMEFSAILHVKRDPNADAAAAAGAAGAASLVPSANSDVAAPFVLSDENKQRIVSDKADEEKRKEKEAARLIVLSGGELMTKHSVVTDPTPTYVYYKAPDKLNPCGSIYWADADVKESEREHPQRRLGIHRIAELLHGKFKGPIPLPDDTSKCFAIVSPDGTLNLEAASAQSATDWTNTIERILSDNNFVSTKA